MDMRFVLVTIATGAGGLSISADAVPMVADPASALCAKNGAAVVMESDENGGQRGICVFPDGTRIPEWTYFRNKSRLAK